MINNYRWWFQTFVFRLYLEKGSNLTNMTIIVGIKKLSLPHSKRQSMGSMWHSFLCEQWPRQALVICFIPRAFNKPKTYEPIMSLLNKRDSPAMFTREVLFLGGAVSWLINGGFLNDLQVLGNVHPRDVHRFTELSSWGSAVSNPQNPRR